MKVKEQARKVLADALVHAAEYEAKWDKHPQAELVVIYMTKKGWDISLYNVLDTARDLGFPVIGNRIYGLDE